MKIELHCFERDATLNLFCRVYINSRSIALKEVLASACRMRWVWMNLKYIIGLVPKCCEESRRSIVVYELTLPYPIYLLKSRLLKIKTSLTFFENAFTLNLGPSLGEIYCCKSIYILKSYTRNGKQRFMFSTFRKEVLILSYVNVFTLVYNKIWYYAELKKSIRFEHVCFLTMNFIIIQDETYRQTMQAWSLSIADDLQKATRMIGKWSMCRVNITWPCRTFKTGSSGSFI